MKGGHGDLWLDKCSVCVCARVRDVDEDCILKSSYRTSGSVVVLHRMSPQIRAQRQVAPESETDRVPKPCTLLI